MADDFAPTDEPPEAAAPAPAEASDAIVRHDFPTGFRGFEPGEVMAHLERVAARIENRS